tara:strand:- start:652 stop:855 length:204 start_codon:yes stop_codon:yes gene_type:complete
MTKLTVHDTENIKVSESLHNWGRCITVSITSEDYSGHSTTTDIELFTKYPKKSFRDYISKEEVEVIV